MICQILSQPVQGREGGQGQSSFDVVMTFCWSSISLHKEGSLESVCPCDVTGHQLVHWYIGTRCKSCRWRSTCSLPLNRLGYTSLSPYCQRPLLKAFCVPETPRPEGARLLSVGG